MPSLTSSPKQPLYSTRFLKSINSFNTIQILIKCLLSEQGNNQKGKEDRYSIIT